MPATALDWMEALDRSFAQSAQPLIAYNQEQRRLKEQARLRQQSLDDQQRQFAHEEKMVDLHAQAYGKQMTEQYKAKSEAEQEVLRKNELAAARGLGVTKEQLPDDAPYSDIAIAQAKARGRKAISAAKAGGAALNAYAAYLGKTSKEVATRIADQAVAAITPEEKKKAKVSDADLEQIRQNPDAANGLIAKAINAKNTAAGDLFRRIRSDISGRLQTELDIAAKSNQRLTGLSEKWKMAHDNYLAILKEGPIDEASQIIATDSLFEDAFPKEEEKPDTNPFTPPPLKKTDSSAPGGPGWMDRIGQWFRGSGQSGTAPPAQNPSTPGLTAGQWMDKNLWPAPAGQGGQPSAFSRGTDALMNLIAPRATDAPAIQPWLPAPPGARGTQVISPKLAQVLADSAAQQNAVAPTAFPPMPMPGHPDYQGVVGFEY